MEGSFAMNGGDSPNSYTQNSKFQGENSDQAKVLLQGSIREHLVLPLDSRSASNQLVFRIGDLGCSTGPNTFASVQTIIGSIVSEYKAKGLESKIPEFQVFFNDRVNNDFNTLFRNLPLERPYTAAGVPGSFHERLFPKASVDLFHSAIALHWLSGVPDEVKKPDSPIFNKGRVTYVESTPGVIMAYKDQFKKDVKAFLSARSIEMADNGLLAILMPCRPDGTAVSSSEVVHSFECFGRVLTDMATEGLVEEELVDSFNLPIFLPTASEVTEVVSEINSLTVEVVEEIKVPIFRSEDMLSTTCLHLRAVFEGTLRQHFNSRTTDILFQRLLPKLVEFVEHSPYSKSEKLENLFVLIKKVPAC